MSKDIHVRMSKDIHVRIAKQTLSFFALSTCAQLCFNAQHICYEHIM